MNVFIIVKKPQFKNNKIMEEKTNGKDLDY